MVDLGILLARRGAGRRNPPDGWSKVDHPDCHIAIRPKWQSGNLTTDDEAVRVGPACRAGPTNPVRNQPSPGEPLMLMAGPNRRGSGCQIATFPKWHPGPGKWMARLPDCYPCEVAIWQPYPRPRHAV